MDGIAFPVNEYLVDSKKLLSYLASYDNKAQFI